MKHPAILQIRGSIDEEKKNAILNMIGKFGEEFEIERTKNGIDVYFSDVNVARNVISKLNKMFKAEVKMSTKYAGLRKGRVRVLFVYSFRIKD